MNVCMCGYLYCLIVCLFHSLTTGLPVGLLTFELECSSA
jgi:hypothetical protein